MTILTHCYLKAKKKLICFQQLLKIISSTFDYLCYHKLVANGWKFLKIAVFMTCKILYPRQNVYFKAINHYIITVINAITVTLAEK